MLFARNLPCYTKAIFFLSRSTKRGAWLAKPARGSCSPSKYPLLLAKQSRGDLLSARQAKSKQSLSRSTKRWHCSQSLPEVFAPKQVPPPARKQSGGDRPPSERQATSLPLNQAVGMARKARPRFLLAKQSTPPCPPALVDVFDISPSSMRRV